MGLQIGEKEGLSQQELVLILTVLSSEIPENLQKLFFTVKTQYRQEIVACFARTMLTLRTCNTYASVLPSHVECFLRKSLTPPMAGVRDDRVIKITRQPPLKVPVKIKLI